MTLQRAGAQEEEKAAKEAEEEAVARWLLSWFDHNEDFQNLMYTQVLRLIPWLESLFVAYILDLGHLVWRADPTLLV